VAGEEGSEVRGARYRGVSSKSPLTTVPTEMTDGRRWTTFTSETSVVYGLPSIVGWGNVLLAYRRR
jgi:hypothetical protein